MAVEDFMAMEPDSLETFCRELHPDAQFRFVTFENDDYRSRNLTCCLYNFVPDSVFFSVKSLFEIETAISELIVLNPGVKWYLVTLHYFDHIATGHPTTSIELSLSEIPFRVNGEGVLIFK